MKLRIVLFLLIALLFADRNAEAQRKGPAPTPKVLTSRQIAEKVMPSVVLIITQDENGNPLSQGSGFVYQPGLVATSLHIFERASSAIVKSVETGETYRAVEVVAMRAIDDICVLRIETKRFPPLSLGDSDKVRAGDDIYIASNPKGLEGSFTKGIVSALRDDGMFEKGDGLYDLAEAFGLLDQKIIQFDAAVSSGSSGGVLLNSRAEAIGIIRSSIVGGQNLNFAVPISKLKSLPHDFKHPIQLAGACAYSDREKEKLKGPVKNVVAKSPSLRVEDGKLIDDGIQVTAIVSYDVHGNETSRTIFDMNDRSRGFKMTFTYDENHLKTKIVEEALGGKSSELTFTREGAIDNKLINRKFSGSIGALGEPGGMQVFDRDGNMILWHIRGTKQTYEYDNERRATGKIQSRNGEMEIRTQYRYKVDRFGNWIEKSELTNFPNSTSREIRPNEWIEGDTEYREITYYD